MVCLILSQILTETHSALKIMASECVSSEDKLGEDGAWRIFQAGLIEIPPGKWHLARRQEGLLQYWNTEKMGVEKESDNTLEGNDHTLEVLLCSKIWTLCVLKGILTWKLVNLVKPGFLGFFWVTINEEVKVKSHMVVN